MIRRVSRELAMFMLFAGLAVILTWPLAREASTAVADRGDPLLNAFIIDWVCHALLHAPLDLYEPPIYHTGILPLAYSENMVGIALAVLPFHAAGLSAVAVYNVAMLLGFAFSGYGMFVLARLIARNTPAAILAGIVFAFGSFPLSHLSHLQYIWSGWLPLLLAAVLVYWRDANAKHAFRLGAAFLMNGLTNVYFLLFGGVTIVVTIVFLAVGEPRRERRFWIRLAVALGLASLLLLPFLIPYQMVADAYDARRVTSEGREFSASLSDWFIASSRNALYGSIADPALHRAERELFPGLLAPLLALYAFLVCSAANPNIERGGPPSEGVQHPSPSLVLVDAAIVLLLIATYFTAVADRVTIGSFTFAGSDVPATLAVGMVMTRLAIRFPLAWGGSQGRSLRTAIRGSRFGTEALSAAVWVGVGFVASLGWNAFLHPFLFRLITPFRATRAPARWAVIVYVGLAVWAALGMTELLTRRKPLTQKLLAAALLAAALVEVFPRIHWDHVDPRVSPVYRWLAETKPGVTLELPIFGDGVQYRYVLATAVHRVPIINGTSGWESPLHEYLRMKEERLAFDSDFMDTIERNDCAVVIVHDGSLSPERRTAVDAWLHRQAGAGRLAFIRRFDDDVVYAVTRNYRGVR